MPTLNLTNDFQDVSMDNYAIVKEYLALQEEALNTGNFTAIGNYWNQNKDVLSKVIRNADVFNALVEKIEDLNKIIISKKQQIVICDHNADYKDPHADEYNAALANQSEGDIWIATYTTAFGGVNYNTLFDIRVRDAEDNYKSIISIGRQTYVLDISAEDVHIRTDELTFRAIVRPGFYELDGGLTPTTSITTSIEKANYINLSIPNLRQGDVLCLNNNSDKDITINYLVVNGEPLALYNRATILSSSKTIDGKSFIKFIYDETAGYYSDNYIAGIVSTDRILQNGLIDENYECTRKLRTRISKLESQTGEYDNSMYSFVSLNNCITNYDDDNNLRIRRISDYQYELSGEINIDLRLDTINAVFKNGGELKIGKFLTNGNIISKRTSPIRTKSNIVFLKGLNPGMGEICLKNDGYIYLYVPKGATMASDGSYSNVTVMINMIYSII